MQQAQVPAVSWFERCRARVRSGMDSARKRTTLPLFALSSLASFGIDYAAVLILSSVTSGLTAEQSLLVSVVGARLISSLFNFSVNRRLVFRASGRALPAALRYYALASAILAANYALLRWQTLTLEEPLWSAKIVTESMLFLFSYAVQEHLVFAHRRPVALPRGEDRMIPAEPAHRRRRPDHPAWLAAMDVALIGASLCVFALFHHVLPQRLSPDLSLTAPASATEEPGSGHPAGDGQVAREVTLAYADAEPTAAPEAEATPTVSAEADASASAFTSGGVIATDTSYGSDSVSVTVTTVVRDGVTYHVEDVYLRDATLLRTAFAQDTYGRSITDWTLSMATAHGAIAAVNGDYYGASGGGVVIRNGHLYAGEAQGDVCVLYADGTMEVIRAEEFDADAVMAAGAWQAWDFGPALLQDGQALTQFRSRISGDNPRTAIGYYEPGHYCFVVVDGRQQDSAGMSLDELAELFEELGCTEAYNLDGGKSSAMVFEGYLVSDPADGGRRVSDIVFIAEAG